MLTVRVSADRGCVGKPLAGYNSMRPRGGEQLSPAEQPSNRSLLLQYVLCYVLWLVIIALGYVVIVIIWRQALQSVLLAFIDETDIDARLASDAIFRFSFVLMGLGFFVMIMGGEPYLRRGVERRQLLPRFFRLATPLGIAGIVGAIVWGIAHALA
ncbi:MAG: hypothetical protein M3281_02460 [Chloroflexota bacterium]|nr:hypothetical protein [Chloroflexota bacterium]